VGKKVPHAASSQPDQIATPSFEELAAQQGVLPIDNFDELLGKPAPGDESVEQFSAMLRGIAFPVSKTREPHGRKPD
jgi:hypothetical protein